MKASELIKSLQEAIEQHGDLEVYSPEECWLPCVKAARFAHRSEDGTEGEESDEPCFVV
jgi:hypothetical protein